METIQRLCDDAREREQVDPDGTADPFQIELFNAQLDEARQRYPHDGYIGAIPRVLGEISNQLMFIRARNLRAALLTVLAETPDAA